MRLIAGLAAAVLLVCGAPAVAAPSPPALTRTGQTVTWQGTTPRPDPVGCGELVSLGCDVTALSVVAKQGAWITISVDNGGYLRVTQDGTYVGGNGFHQGTRTEANTKGSTTFQQLRSGRVVYEVGVSSAGGGFAYTGTARLAGMAFDRSGECLAGDGGVDDLLAPDDGKLLPLSVRLVSSPADRAETLRLGPTIVSTYRRIGVVVRVSYDAMPLVGYESYPFEVVQRRYGGVRPRGVDVVHVVSDDFTGGFADCIGGVAYPEKGFSTGSLHYDPTFGVPQPAGSGASIAVHEIGHQLGGQHQMFNCAESLPQLLAQPSSSGNLAPCTVMSTIGMLQGEAFSTQERATIRAYARRYARG